MSIEAMTIHEAHDDDLGATLSRNNLAWIALERGDFAAAERHFDAVIASHSARGDARAAAAAMSWLGVLEERRGALARAVALHTQALDVGGPVADLGYRTLVLVRLSAARHALDDRDDQTAIVRSEYVPALREFGRLWPLGYGLAELGVMLLDRGDVSEARAALEEALDARRATGSASGVAETLLWLGVVHHRAGDGARAAASLDQALAAASDYGARPLLIAGIEAVAALALDAGRADRAATLLGAADRARDALGMGRSPRRRRDHVGVRRAIADALGDEARLADASAAGAAMALDAAAVRARAALRGVTPG
jgi:tetratricopeptide (TPR) repeat protein